MATNALDKKETKFITDKEKIENNQSIQNIPKKVPMGVRFAAGLLGSTLSSFICSPLDLIKVRLQVSYEKGTKKYSDIFDAIKTIYREEGMRGFLKGTRVAVVTVPIFYSLYFPLYEHFKAFYSSKIYHDTHQFNSVVYTLSAVSSALICDLLTNPMWVVRVRYQAEFIMSGNNKIDSFNVIKSINKLYKREGFFALYRGLVASLFGIPHVVVQFNIYEHLKLMGAKKYNRSVDNLPIHVILFNSVFSKICASFCTYPHEVIRNNLQNYRHYAKKKMHIRMLIKDIYHERGIPGFYAGFKINLIRILPNTAIMFMAYEYLTKIMTEKYHDYEIKNGI